MPLKSAAISDISLRRNGIGWINACGKVTIMILQLFEYAILGALAGLIAGLLGVGGAILIVPSLLFIFASNFPSPAAS